MSEDLYRHPAVVMLEDLLGVGSPSGREERLASVVRDVLNAMGYEHETDGAGNVSVRLEGAHEDAGLVVYASHMDEIGMVVTGVEEDGTLRVDRSGGLNAYKIGERPVEIVGDGDVVTGVISMGSAHSSGMGDRAVGWGDVKILTGMSKEQLKARGVRAGSTVVPARFTCGPVIFGDEDDPLLAAWTLDDRMGVVTLLRLLELIKEEGIVPPRPTMVAFTVHEEGGCQGAKVLAQRERPEVFVAVDGCPMPEGCGLVLDDRPGVWSKDRGTHFDQRLVVDLMKAAGEVGVELQPVVYEAAFSDASHVYMAGAASRVATIGHVRENSHGYEVARLGVFDNLLETLGEFVATWNG